MQELKSVCNCRGAIWATLGILLLAVPAIAQEPFPNRDVFEPVPDEGCPSDIEGGADAWVTASGTLADLDIPACFFCDDSDPINIPGFTFSGMPLVTNPPGVLNPVDTIIQRLKDVNVQPGQCADVPIVVRAMKLVGDDLLTVTCNSTGETSQWEVTACTCSSCCAVQPITTLRVCNDGPCDQLGGNCGHADGKIKVDVCLKFRNVVDGTVLGPIQQRVNLDVVNMPWCDKNPGGVVEFPDAFHVDTDCDLQADFALGCTSNFFPGATCAPQCPPPVCHPNPSGGHQHCVQPPCQ